MKTLKILLAEDDFADQLSFKRMVKDKNLPYEYVIASSLNEARQILNEKHFDLIVSDFSLGDGTGLELMRHVKDRTPFIITTGSGDEEIAIQLMREGAYDYLIKDMQANYIHMLPLTIEKAINRKAIEDEIGKLSLVASKTDNSVVIADKDGNIEWVNEGFTRITGFKPEEVIGTSGEVLRQGQETELKKFREYYNNSIKAGQKIFSHSYDTKNFTKDGVEFWAHTVLSPILDENGELVSIIGIDLDITERVRAEEELIKAKENAEHLAAAKEQFLANMSHEIRTPMNAVISLTNILLKTPLRQDQKDYLGAIKTSGDLLLVIINDILDIAKIEAGKMRLEKTDFNLSHLISSLIDILEPKAQEKEIKLTAARDENIQDILVGDTARLNQILMNLVGNAIKFTNAGEVRIVTKLLKEDAENVEIEFSVIDTGIGIPEEKLSSIFESFTQVGSENSRKFGGTGLGLSIAKRLVELQGGTLFVKSKPNEGSTFGFTLTYKKSTVKELDKQPLPEISIDPALKDLKILLVEDNRINQFVAKSAMAEWNYKIDVAENGKIAIEKLKSGSYDLILMDIQMPEMDGYDTTRIIRKDLKEKVKDIPIIAMTAYASDKVAEKCFACGMNDYISKPIDPGVLYAKIETQLKFKLHLERNDGGKAETKSAAAPNAVRPLLNLDHLKKNLKGNNELILEMIDIFVKEMPVALQNMKDDFKNREWKALGKEAHKMKSSVIYFGIDKMMGLLERIEEHAEKENKTGGVQDLINQLDTDYALAVNELEAERNTILK